jgi:hypothetical protein
MAFGWREYSQGFRVQSAPLLVGVVAALDELEDRQVHVKLRVAIPGDVVRESAGDQAVTVPATPPC